jgi:hypothetical protein
MVKRPRTAPRFSYWMMTRSWRRLAEALGPGMIDLKKFKDMDRRSGRPEEMPRGSRMYDLGNLAGSPTRPPLEMPPQDHGLEDTDWIDQGPEVEDESAFSHLSHKLAGEPGVTDPDALAATIGRKKYGAAGMAAKSAAGRRRQ